jgi:hypothetical protein
LVGRAVPVGVPVPWAWTLLVGVIVTVTVAYTRGVLVGGIVVVPDGYT